MHPQRSTIKVENRFIHYQQKSKELYERLSLEQFYREVSMLKQKPTISERSRRIVAKKSYSPIYTHRRMLQIKREKRNYMNKISKTQIEPQSDNIAKPNKTKNILNDTSFNTTRTTCKRAATSLFNRMVREYTTEEREAVKNCTFRPKIDKKSQEIFTKRNVKSKNVIQRLMDYKHYRDLLHKERIAESRPSFTPNLCKATSIKVSVRIKRTLDNTKEYTT